MGIIDIGSLETVLSRYDPIIIQSAQCVRERYATASCNECVKLCPRMAISFTPNLNIDFNLCDGCLVCTALCPTSVFLAKAGSDIALLKQVKERLTESKDISFACTAASVRPPAVRSFMRSGGEDSDAETAADDEIELPQPAHNHAGCIKVPCLGRVDDAVIVGALGNGANQVWLDTSLCTRCWRSNGLQVASQSFKYAQGILSLFGRESQVTFSDEPPFGLVPVADKVEISPEAPARDGDDEPGLSRRNFFSGLKGGAMQTGGAIIDHKVKELAELTDDGSGAPSTLDRRLPTRHALIIHFIRTFGQPIVDHAPANSLPFGQLTVEDSCIFCGHCERFCPTDAIAVVDLPESKMVGTLSTLCVDCGLCADVCPPQSIAYRETIDVKTLAGGKIERSLEGQMAKCKECKQQFFSVNRQKVCPFCELRRKKHGDMSWS